MANLLTGDFEAAVQIAVRQINGLLGTLHQKGAIESAVLKLLHSASLRIGDPPRRFPDVDVFADWLIQFQKADRGRGLNDIRAELAATAPPGAARLLSDALAGFDRNWVFELPRDVVRGLAKVQVSTVTISVPSGSSSEVTVHARIRAHYYPDQGTTDLPAPVHGDVNAAFDVRKENTPSGARLVVQPSSQDSKIQFVPAPGAGLDAVETSKISAEIRKALRQSLTHLPVDLPADFPFADFKGLGSGSNQLLALPFHLSGAAPPSSGAGSLTHSFIGSSGFAFAVSKQHVINLIDIEAIRQAITQRRIVVRIDRWFDTVSVTYRLRFSEGPTLTFRSGGIEISGRVEVETPTWWAPNGFVSFRQLIALVLDVPSQTIRLERSGEPSVDESWFIPHSTAVNVVRSEIDRALTANTLQIRRVFTDGKNALLRGLRTFDSAATVSFTGAEVTADGVIVRGDIGSGARRAPAVHVGETHQGAAFTAFQSWIPAGRINRFVWSWVEYSGPVSTIWSGTLRTLMEEHRFILPKPAGITEVSNICLRIEGTQTTPSGQQVNVSGGTVCRVPEPEFTMDLPSWWGPLTLPIWRPDLDHATPLRSAIAGHISVQTNTPSKEPSSRNTLVYFADWSSEKPLEALGVALSRVRNVDALMVIAVLPAGAFDRSRREVESRLPPALQRIPVHFTEDDEKAWTRLFAVAKTPSAYLINSKREFVWKHEGEPDPAALAEAIDKQPVPRARTSRSRALQLAVSPGDAALDATFEDDRKQGFALHRFRGREMLLNFWQSWSAPCLVELSRLQRLHQGGGEKPFIVAFHGGENSKTLDDVRKRLGLTFPLVQDAQQRVARRYGVRCWPTTITVDAEGHVQHVQFGTEHEHEQRPDREQSKPAETSA